MKNITSLPGYVAAGTVPPSQCSCTNVNVEPASSPEQFMPIYQSTRRHIICHRRHCENIISLTTWPRSLYLERTSTLLPQYTEPTDILCIARRTSRKHNPSEDRV